MARTTIGGALLLALAGGAQAQEADLYDTDVLRTLRLTFHQAQWWQELMSHVDDDVYIPADLEVEGQLFRDVGVRFRGHSSFVFVKGLKKPFKIKLDAFHPGQELYGYDTLRLNNGWADPTLMRDALSNHVLAPYMPTVRQNWVVLEINGESWGVYGSEQQQDKTWMGEHFAADTGNRYHVIEGHGLTWMGPKKKPYKKEFQLTNPPGTDPYVDLIRMIDVLNHEPDESLLTALPERLHLDGAYWFLAGQNLLVNADTYVNNSQNYVLVHDDLHGRLEIVAHDMDLILGGYNAPPTAPPDLWWGSGSRPLTDRVLPLTRARKEYVAHLRTMNEEALRWDVIEPVLRRWHGTIDAAMQADPKRLYSYQAFNDNFTQEVTIEGGLKVAGLRPFIEARHAYLADHPWLKAATVTLEGLRTLPHRPEPHQPVRVLARVVGETPAKAIELRWRARGAFRPTPMHDDGLHGDGLAGDGLYAAEIPGQRPGARVDWYLVATADAQGKAVSFFPKYGGYGPTSFSVAFGGSGLRVTEYLYSGADGEYVELTNTGDAPLDLTGWSLDDRSATPGRLDLSPAGVVAPGQSILVTEADAATFRAAWGLAPATVVLGGNDVANLGRNDAVHVFDAAGRLRDRLTYGDEDFPGTPRAKDESAWLCAEALGRDDAYALAPSTPGDAQLSWTSTGGDVGSPGSHLPQPCPALGTVYCTSNPNSTGQVATLAAAGSASVAENALVLRAEQLPPLSWAMPLTSEAQAVIPGFGQGVLCLGAPVVRFPMLRRADAAGALELSPDLTAVPDAGVAPGETWCFQLWYRDGSSWNTTDAVAVELR